MNAIRNVNDGSSTSPRLVIYGNAWGLMELPRPPRVAEWSLEEKLDRLVEAGFAGFQGSVTHAELTRRKGLRFCTSGRVNESREAEAHCKSARDCGAECTTVHVGWGMESDDQMDALVGAVLESSAKHNVPAYIETHRATVAQDMWRIVQLIKRTPEVRFNGDFSHLYCGQEMPYGDFNAKLDFLDPLFQRVSFFHGRIGTAECMQWDVGDGTGNPQVEHFKEMWKRSMIHWLNGALPGDVLPFAPELGPASSRYSISWEGVELSDRWEQTKVLKRLAEETFADAQRAVA